MFRMSHDAVDFFSADFTAAGVIVAGEEYPLGYFAAEALEVSVGDSINYMRYSPYFSQGDDPINTAKATVCAIVDSFPGYERYRYV